MKKILFMFLALFLMAVNVYAEKPPYLTYNNLANKTVRIDIASKNLSNVFGLIESQIRLYQQVYGCTREEAYNKISQADADAYLLEFESARDEIHAAADDYPRGN